MPSDPGSVGSRIVPASGVETNNPGQPLGRKAVLQLQQISRIIFHRRENYRSWSRESSKYPSHMKWSGSPESLISIIVFDTIPISSDRMTT
jgi:hypothetical protein